MITVGIPDVINFAIAVSGLSIALMVLILAARAEYMDIWSRRFFICFFSILLLYEAFDLLSQISLVFMGTGMHRLSALAVFFESFFSSILMLMLTAYILHLCGQSFRDPLFIINTLIWFVYITLLLIAQKTTFIYQITDENIYVRGPLYPVLLIPPFTIMLLNLIGIYTRKNLLPEKERRAFLLYILIPMLTMIIQMQFYGLLLIVFGTAVSSLIMFLFILNDQTEKAIRLSTELAEQQYRIRSLQIRPHFIYNTLSNIYYLCDINPQKAQVAIGDFTDYLRNNFSAVVRAGLIPFEDELKHTRAYLAVVKMRYEDLLFVEYDTEYTSFYVPPLTLEPIAENAVKHGLDVGSAPLKVVIKTRLTEDASEIIVENSGMEFSLEDEKETSLINDDEIHIGLNNVISRLDSLCNGTLTLRPRTGGGAVVTIRIPLSSP